MTQPISDLSSFPVEPQAGQLGDQANLVAPVKLSPTRYKSAIQALVRAASVAYGNRSHMTYTEGWLRWSGITEHRRSIDDQYPPYADCSAFVTWCYWDATRFLDLADVLNQTNWTGGYTGTLTLHGEHIERGHTVPGDVVLYGGTEWVPQHTAMTIGGERVISFGHPGDPEIYPIDLYGTLPIVGIRRYLAQS